MILSSRQVVDLPFDTAAFRPDCAFSPTALSPQDFLIETAACSHRKYRLEETSIFVYVYLILPSCKLRISFLPYHSTRGPIKNGFREQGISSVALQDGMSCSNSSACVIQRMGLLGVLFGCFTLSQCLLFIDIIALYDELRRKIELCNP